MQDRQGILWIGNRIAINRFDGEKTYLYHLEENSYINQFFEDLYNNIWMATGNGLYFFDKKNDCFVKVKSNIQKVNKLFDSSIFCIYGGEHNEIVISGEEKYLIKLSVNSKGHIVESSIQIINKPLNSGYVTKIVRDVNSGFWLGTNKGEILHVENNVARESGFVKAGNNFFINDISIDAFDNLWIATNGNGLYRYNIKNSDIKHFEKNDNSKGLSINNDVVTKLYIEGYNVWIGTDGGGLNLFEQNKNLFNYYLYDFGNEFSISDNSVIDIQPGLNGTILLGTVHGGVSIFRNNYKIENIAANNFKFLNQDPQGSRVLEDSYNNIWLSAGRSGLRRYNTKTKSSTIFSSEDSGSGFSGNIVLSLFEDQNKRIWVGTLREGVNIFDLKIDKFIPFPQGKGYHGVFSVAEDNQGNIWVGHRKGIAVYNKDLKLTNEINLSTKAYLNTNQVMCMYKDVAGDMWVGTTDGLFKFEKKGKGYLMIKYKHRNNYVNTLSSSHILSIGETNDFSILIGTYGNGLNKYDRQTGTFKRINNEIKGGIIRGILKDREKNIWLSTNAGLTKIDTKNNITNFGISDGIFPFNGGEASLNSKGEILMAGVYGLSYFKPKKLEYTNYFPNVYFTSVKSVDGNKETFYSLSKFYNDTIEIEPGNKLLNINFSSSELYAKKDIEYQYSMEGLNDGWQNLGEQNKISFSNLDPGKYKLKVKATNNSKLWSSKYSTLYIIIKPSFFQRSIVKLLLIAGFIYLLFFVYRLRTSSIKKQKEKLQNLLDLKTIEVKKQEQKISQSKISMLEIEKQNQELKQKKLEDELKFKIDELTNNTLRAMHKNNLLTDIKDKLKVELKNKIVDKKNLEDIVSHINDSFILDADWESFYTLLNQVHPTFVKKLKQQHPTLSEREVRLCALILIDFSSQHIATLFGISLTSVKVARHRLRKKLNIANDESMKKFMQEISLD